MKTAKKATALFLTLIMLVQLISFTAVTVLAETDITDGLSETLTDDDSDGRVTDETGEPVPAETVNSVINISGASAMTVGYPSVFNALVYDSDLNPVSESVNWEIYDTDFPTLDPSEPPSPSNSSLAEFVGGVGGLSAGADIGINPIREGIIHIVAWVMSDTGRYIYSNVITVAIEAGDPVTDNCVVAFSSTVGGSVSAEINGGSFITTGDSVRLGTSITFTATPDDGYNVKQWTIAEGESEAYDELDGTGAVSAPLTLTKAALNDLTVTVIFEESCTVAFGVTGGGGTISAISEIQDITETRLDAAIYVAKDRNVSFTAIPDPGYKVSAWLINEPDSDGNIITYYIDNNGDAVPLTEEDANSGEKWTSAALSWTVVHPEIAVSVIFEAAPPEITTTALPEGKRGIDYPDSAVLKGRGLYGTARWSLAAEEDENGNPLPCLPEGLTMDEDGTIWGIPTESGIFTFTVILEDIVDENVRASVTKEFNIIILNQVTVTYSIDITDGQNGTIAVDYNLPENVLISEDGESVTVNAWEGDKITFIARPNAGYIVGNWISTPETPGAITNNADYTEYRYTVAALPFDYEKAGSAAEPGSFEMTVTFSYKVDYYVYYSVYGENGSVSATLNGAAYAQGQLAESGAVVIKAAPNPGYRVKEWRMTAAASITAPGDFYTNPAYIKSVANFYIAPIPADSKNKYVIVAVEFEPLDAAGKSRIVKRPADDKSVFLPDAAVGINYEALFGVEGVEYQNIIWNCAVEPYGYASDVTINSMGRLSMIPVKESADTPSKRVSITITAQLYSKTGVFIDEPSKTFYLNILDSAKLEISPVMPDGAIDFPYSEFIQYTGTEADVSWTIADSLPDGMTGLPDGLSLSASGEISGTPTVVGVFTFTVRAANYANPSDTAEQSITIIIREPVPPSDIQPRYLPDAPVNIQYNQQLTADGFPDKYTWSITAGILPLGLYLNPYTGTIAGKPVETVELPVEYTFIISAVNGVRDDDGELIAATRMYTITAREVLITPEPPDGKIGEQYHHKFTLSGNIGSEVTWSLTAGSGFPPGLHFNTETGEIFGMPTAAGDYEFTVTAAEKSDDKKSSFSVTGQFTLTVEGKCGFCDTGIIYDPDGDVKITGATFPFRRGKTIPEDAAYDDTCYINLTQETLTAGDYTILAYSSDGGMKWKTGTLTPEAFVKLLNKNTELWLCFKDYNAGAKKPESGGTEHNIIAFAAIAKRAKAPAYAVNYAIYADDTGITPGAWTLCAKTDMKNASFTPAMAVKDGLEIGAAGTESKAAAKTVDSKGWGKFCPDCGVSVQSLSDSPSGKAYKSAYYVRTAAEIKKDSSGNIITYAAASKPKKIMAASEQKAPAYKVNEREGVIKYKADTLYCKDDIAAQDADWTNVEYRAEKGELNISDYSGFVYMWVAASAKKPATAKQKLPVV